MIFQVVSDVHLEFRSSSSVETVLRAPPGARNVVLIVAGDLATCGSDVEFAKVRKFMEWAAGKYAAIVYVPGNHEFYTVKDHRRNNMDVILRRIRVGLKDLPVHFLYNQMAVVLGVCIIGATMWTDFCGLPAAVVSETVHRMNDFTSIYVADPGAAAGSRRLRASDVCALHRHAVKCIARHITEAKKKDLPIVVVTHHKPTVGGVLVPGYEVDMTPRLLRPPVALWVHGHMHVHEDRRVGGVRVYANPMGYPHEAGVNYSSSLIRLTTTSSGSSRPAHQPA
jgi:3',5'-cyclic AMP phosphodiesterase CpdA